MGLGQDTNPNLKVKEELAQRGAFLFSPQTINVKAKRVEGRARAQHPFQFEGYVMQCRGPIIDMFDINTKAHNIE